MRKLKGSVSLVGILLVVDFLGFCFWAMSGQIPADNFYLGIITKTIISLFI